MEGIKSLIVAGIIILVIIAGGIFFYSRNSSGKMSGKSSSQQTTQSANTQSGQVQVASEQDIYLTPKGFSPNELVVKVGTRVKWINNSGTIGDVDSDPHPSHTSYPAMNFGSFSNGSSVELIFDKPGNYHYHNHLNPSQTGGIIVQ